MADSQIYVKFKGPRIAQDNSEEDDIRDRRMYVTYTVHEPLVLAQRQTDQWDRSQKQANSGPKDPLQYNGKRVDFRKQYWMQWISIWEKKKL